MAKKENNTPKPPKSTPGVITVDSVKRSDLSAKSTIKLKGLGDYKASIQPESDAELSSYLRQGNTHSNLVDVLHPGMSIPPSSSLKFADISKMDLERTCFNQTDFTQCDARHSQLRSARFKGCDLSGADFRNADLTSCIFDDCNLNGADFRNARLEGARMVDCELFAVNLDGSCLNNAAIDTCNMGAQSFHNASCLGLKMSNSQVLHGFFNDADMSGCELRNMAFKNCTLSHTDFHDAKMDDCQFKGCDSFEVGPVFSGGNLNRIVMEDCDFQVAKWVETKVSNSYLARMDMGANLFEGTSFDQVVFEQGELKECYSLDKGPTFNRCRLDHVKINQADLMEARFDSSSFVGATIVDSDFSSWSLNHTGIDNETSIE